MNQRYRNALTLGIAICLSACATTTKGTLLGAAIGGGSGLAISSVGGGRSEQRVTGLAIGALVGGVIGYIASEKMQSSQPKPDQRLNPELVPRLIRPEVRKIWVPEQIVGDEFVSGHWKFVIEKNAAWTKRE